MNLFEIEEIDGYWRVWDGERFVAYYTDKAKAEAYPNLSKHQILSGETLALQFESFKT